MQLFSNVGKIWTSAKSSILQCFVLPASTSRINSLFSTVVLVFLLFYSIYKATSPSYTLPQIETIRTIQNYVRQFEPK
ncbi:hypothetical protein OESDEN_19419, partial [Oesophagostomum dentatum]